MGSNPIRDAILRSLCELRMAGHFLNGIDFIEKLTLFERSMLYEALCGVEWNKRNQLMCYVYFLKSIKNPSKTYIGYTTNLKQRLQTHNSGGSIFTEHDMPWKLVAYVAFDSEEKALSFERYVKVGSGYAFAKRRLW